MSFDNIPEVLKVYIPNRIDLDALLHQYPILIPNQKQYLLYILSRITKKGEFTQINSKALKKIVDLYAPLIDWLIKREILERDPSYKVGEWSRGYRFTEDYLTELKEENITLRTLIRKILKNKNSSRIANPNSPVSEPDSGIYYYGYQQSWIALTEMAERLGLRPIKMRQGLESLGLIREVYEHHLPANSANVLCCYELIVSEKRVYDKRIIDENAIEEIKLLVATYPHLFPKTK